MILNEKNDFERLQQKNLEANPRFFLDLINFEENGQKTEIFLPAKKSSETHSTEKNILSKTQKKFWEQNF